MFVHRFSDLPELIAQGLGTIADIYAETAKVSPFDPCGDPVLISCRRLEYITGGHVSAKYGDPARIDAASLVRISLWDD